MSLRQLLEDSTGLALDAAAVERAVRERMQKNGIQARAAYAPAPGAAEFDALVDLLVVPESWMFRDPAAFEEALRFARRRLALRPGHQLRILSLPCAGGEEPYSMAMALDRAGIDPGRCRIDAFDLSHAAIARARAGRYTRNAFRGADLAFRDRYFMRGGDGDGWLIGAAPRAYVAFAQANLFTLGGPGMGGRYDLIFCRNLLIYFDDPARTRAVRILHSLLADDGLLLSGPAEAPAFCRHGFRPRPERGAFALYKQHAAMPAARRPPVLRTAPAPLPRQLPTAALPTPQDLLAEARREANAGHLAQAEAACRVVLAAQSDKAEAWFLLGMISECGGDARAAERYWRRCVYLDPGHYEALCGLALLHEEQGDGARSASFRQRAARIFERRGSTNA